mgnify:FL=1
MCHESMRGNLCALVYYFVGGICYYKFLLPTLFDVSLHDPEITVLATQRSYKPIGGVLRHPTTRRQQARLYGEADPPLGHYCYMLILWSDDYILPAAVLVRSLMLHGTSHEIHILVPRSGPDRVSQRGIDALEMLGARVTTVAGVYELLDLPEPKEYNDKTGTSGGTDSIHPTNYVSPMFLKLHAFSFQGTYDRVLLLDADALVVTNIDPLLFAPACLKVDLCTAYTTTSVSAPTSKYAQDMGISGYFNAGFLHLKPSTATYKLLVEKARTTHFLTSWAYEQDFLNQMVHEKILTSAQIKPVGHFNKFPATRLIHYTSGKPWGWRSYPVHMPWTPRRKFWGIVRSWSWISTRYTLPGSFSLVTPTAFSMLCFPILIIVVMSKPAFAITSITTSMAFVGVTARIGRRRVSVPRWYETCIPVGLLWLMTIGAPRLKYDPGWLLPDRMPPTTAWLVLAWNTSAVVYCTYPGRFDVFSALPIVLCVVASVCVVTVLELVHVNTSPFGILFVISCGMCSSCFVVQREEKDNDRGRLCLD